MRRTKRGGEEPGRSLATERKCLDGGWLDRNGRDHGRRRSELNSGSRGGRGLG